MESLSGNHLEIVKFSNKDSSNYRDVKMKLAAELSRMHDAGAIRAHEQRVAQLSQSALPPLENE